MSLRSASSRVVAGSLLLFVGVGTAWAQGVDGGCTATVNGRAPASLTAKDPFPVEKDQVVSVTGTVPASVANQRRVESTTELLIFPGALGGVPFKTIEGTGPEWGGEAELPDALFDYAPGIYLVGGSASGTGGWDCEGSGYIEIEGGPFTAALAAGVLFTVVGAFFLKSARGPVRSSSDDRVRKAAGKKGGRATGGLQDAMSDQKPPVVDETTTTDRGASAGEGSVAASKESGTGSLQDAMGERPDVGAEQSSKGTRGTPDAGTKSGGSGNALQEAMHDNKATRRLDALGVVAGAVPLALFLTGTVGSVSTLASGLLLTSLPASSGSTFWVRGRVVLGFFAGLITGIGLSIVLHQFDLWGLAAESGVYFPVVLALLGAIRAWWGRAYTMA